MKFYKINLVAFVLLFTSSISTTLHATECYELLRKACVRDKGNLEWLCKLGSKSEVSNALYADYDKNKEYWKITDKDKSPQILAHSANPIAEQISRLLIIIHHHLV